MTLQRTERERLSARLAAGQRDARLRHGPVWPTWSQDSCRFWYATETASGTQHLLVDVAARRKAPLFDHAALAAALSAQAGRTIDAGRLPVERIEHEADAVTFEAEGARWRWQGATGRLERLGAAFAPHALRSPCGRQALQLEGPNLHLVDADGAARALTRDGEADFGWGDFVDYTTQATRAALGLPLRPQALWSPDGTKLAVLRVDRRHVGRLSLVQSVPREGVRPAVWSYPFPMVPDAARETCTLWLLGVHDGTCIRVEIDPLESFMHRAVQHGQLRWSADGASLFVLDSDLAATRVTLWRVDSATGAAAKLVEETGPAIVRAAPTLGMPPVYQVLGDGRVLWWSQRSGWGHLHLIAADGSSTAVTQGDWQVRGLLHVDEAAGEVVFSAGGREPGVDPYFWLAYRTPLHGGTPRPITPDAADHGFFEPAAVGSGDPTRLRSLSPDGRWLVDVFSTVTQPPLSVLRDARDGRALLELETGDASDAWPAELPAPEPFTVAATDESSLDLWGVLYRPPGFDERQRYPVLEVVYAAPQVPIAPKGWSPAIYGSVAEQLAAAGFVVVIVDGRGTPFRSHAFQCATHGRMEDCGLADHVHALRHLAATRPWMDIARGVGIVGGSGGGFATVRALAAEPDFYRAGVALCGSHDSTAYIPYWGEQFQGPWEPGLYARQDNARIAERIRGALFLVHGEMDDNVHPATTLRLVDALIRADRDFDLLIVPNAGHMLNNGPYVMRRVQDFFIRHLMQAADER